MDQKNIIKCLKKLIFNYKFLYQDKSWINEQTFLNFQKIIKYEYTNYFK